MKMKRYCEGIADWIVIAGIAIIAIVIVNIASHFDDTPDNANSATDASGNLCPTKCAFFVQKTCGQGENNRVLGFCFFSWSCTFDHPDQCVEK
jgi:hypothetical protein